VGQALLERVEPATNEIQQAVDGQRAMANLYRLPAPKGDREEVEVEGEVQRLLSAETSEDDTHPTPQDRFRLGARIASRALAGETGAVWGLFRDPEGLMNEMTVTIARNVAEQTGVAAVVPSGR
jgi:hypothetical protein